MLNDMSIVKLQNFIIILYKDIIPITIKILF